MKEPVFLNCTKHVVRAKSNSCTMLLGVAFSLLSFAISYCLNQSYLGQHASLLAYTGYPGTCIRMSLERSMIFHVLACVSHGPTWVNKQTNNWLWTNIDIFGYRYERLHDSQRPTWWPQICQSSTQGLCQGKNLLSNHLISLGI